VDSSHLVVRRQLGDHVVTGDQVAESAFPSGRLHPADREVGMDETESRLSHEAVHLEVETLRQL
jgi:hypothetical protein